MNHHRYVKGASTQVETGKRKAQAQSEPGSKTVGDSSSLTSELGAKQVNPKRICSDVSERDAGRDSHRLSIDQETHPLSTWLYAERIIREPIERPAEEIISKLVFMGFSQALASTLAHKGFNQKGAAA